jgi:hypothetical protein
MFSLNRFFSYLGFFVFVGCQLVIRVNAQSMTPSPDQTGNQTSQLVLTELWTENFDENTSVQSAYILLDSDQKPKSVEVNANQLEKTDNIWRPTNFSFDLNGAKTEKSHLDDEYVYVSSNGKRISFGESGWKTEDAKGNLIKQSSGEMLKENLRFSPDDSLMIGQDEDGNAALYDGDGNLVKKIEAKGSFSPNSQYIGLIITNPKPPHVVKFCLLDRYGNSVFELPLDSTGVSYSFNEDSTRIFLITEYYFYETDLTGNVILKTALPHRCAFGSIVFLNQNSFVTSGLSNVWKVDLSSGIAKIRSIQKIEYPESIEKIGENLAVIHGLGNEGPDRGIDNGLEIISLTGQLLASAKLQGTSAGIEVKGEYIVVWSTSSLSLFKVSKE